MKRQIGIAPAILIVFLAGCSVPNPSLVGTSASDLLREDPIELISVERAKAIVADHVAKSEFYNRFFTIGSPEFDERCRQITWGEVVLVKVIPDGYFEKETTYYYLLTGTMPDGRVMAAKTINAITGRLETGQIWMDENADTMKIASHEQVLEYVAQNKGFAPEDMKLSRVYYNDGQIPNGCRILSWRYCVERLNTRGARGLDSGDYVLVDPYVRDFSQSPVLSKQNAMFFDRGLMHRLFKFSSLPAGTRSRTVTAFDETVKIVPAD